MANAREVFSKGLLRNILKHFHWGFLAPCSFSCSFEAASFFAIFSAILLILNSVFTTKKKNLAIKDGCFRFYRKQIQQIYIFIVTENVCKSSYISYRHTLHQFPTTTFVTRCSSFPRIRFRRLMTNSVTFIHAHLHTMKVFECFSFLVIV